MVYINSQLEVKDFVQILAHRSLGHIVLSMTPSLKLFHIRKMKKIRPTSFVVLKIICCWYNERHLIPY